MNNLKLVEEREVLGQAFKIYGDFDNPLFLARDIAGWIEHSNLTMMLKSIDDDEQIKIRPKESLGLLTSNNEYNFLTEDGLYEVLMQSRKPIAKAFKVEVKKILKEIRMTGSYMKPSNGVELLNDLTAVVSDMKGTITNMHQSMTAYKSMCKINSRKKRSYTDYIKKRLSITKMNFEYEQVKARVFLVLDIDKWEDIAVEQADILKLIDESIRIIKSERPYEQMSYF